MASLVKVIDQLKVNNDDNSAGAELVAESVTILTKRVDSLLAIMKQSQLDMLEALREKGKPEKDAKPTDDPIKKETSKLPMILAGIAAVAAGILAGLLDSVKKLAQIFRVDRLLKGLNTKFMAFVDDALKVADDLFKPIKTFFSAEGGFARFLTGIRGAFRQTFTGALSILDDLMQPFKTLFAGESVIGQRLTKFFNGIIDIFKFPFEPILDDFGKGIKSIFGAGDDGVGFFRRVLNSIKSVFDPLTDAVNKTLDLIKGAFSIFGEGSRLMSILGSIGRVIGRLFLPFTLIMTAFDTVKGAIAGFEEEGFLGGLTGAFEGLFNSLIGAPLDLLKDAVAWVLSKMGFDDSADALKAFSFSDIITDIIMSPLELIKRAINGVIESIASAIESFDIPFTDAEQDMANALRELKLEEGMTKSEERAVAEEEEKALAREKYDKKRERIERKRDRMRGRLSPEYRDAGDLSAPSGQSAPVVVSAPSSTVNNNSSSSSAMVMPHVAAQDFTDPYELAFAP